ncbi:hypothetical protein B0H34DRAFT_671277 [Crassisporium funariophilum]|nr:hypothetical protein B0H34DRAFT_671277 [Crassisporium funariophilum]
MSPFTLFRGYKGRYEDSLAKSSTPTRGDSTNSKRKLRKLLNADTSSPNRFPLSLPMETIPSYAGSGRLDAPADTLRNQPEIPPVRPHVSVNEMDRMDGIDNLSTNRRSTPLSATDFRPSFSLEDPVVSRYFSDAHRYPQIQTPSPISPVRSWSPIPSVHRESYEVGDEQSYGPKMKDYDREDWIDDQVPDDHRPGYSFQGDRADPRLSTMVEVGLRDSQGREIHYTEYNENPATAQTISHRLPSVRPSQEEEIFMGKRRIPQRKPLPPETIEPAVVEHDYWEEDASEPEIYHYIVPTGLDIIFQDEDGNEITRVGKSGKTNHGEHAQKNVPIVIHDEFGRELFR